MGCSLSCQTEKKASTLQYETTTEKLLNTSFAEKSMLICLFFLSQISLDIDNYKNIQILYQNGIKWSKFPKHLGAFFHFWETFLTRVFFSKKV